jgi:hypothetical protein
MRRGHIGDAGASGKPNADLPRCNADDKGENDRGLITSDTNDCSTRHQLSDRPFYTFCEMTAQKPA